MHHRFEVLPLPNLRPEWGLEAIRQDGQVTNLDLPKAHVLLHLVDLGVCHTHIPSKHRNLVSKPGNHMEFSNHTNSKRGWQGNTIPMAWSTFWIHVSGQFLWEPYRPL